MLTCPHCGQIMPPKIEVITVISSVIELVKHMQQIPNRLIIPVINKKLPANYHTSHSGRYVADSVIAQALKDEVIKTSKAQSDSYELCYGR